MIGGMLPEARALLRAAKSDSPPAVSRASIWNGVEQAAAPLPTSAPSVAATAAPAVTIPAVTMPAVTMKAAFVGAILGSVISAGITLALLRPMHIQATANPPLVAVTTPVLTNPAAETPSTTLAITPAIAPSTTPAVTPPAPATHQEKPRGVTGQDSLSREVALVAEARGELLRGDATRALATIRVARSLKVRQLEPEELALEVRALRALGRTDEADRIDAKLRAEFPEHALAR